jgi:hypothetical protein
MIFQCWWTILLAILSVWLDESKKKTSSLNCRICRNDKIFYCIGIILFSLGFSLSSNSKRHSIWKPKSVDIQNISLFLDVFLLMFSARICKTIILAQWICTFVEVSYISLLLILLFQWCHFDCTNRPKNVPFEVPNLWFLIIFHCFWLIRLSILYLHLLNHRKKQCHLTLSLCEH